MLRHTHLTLLAACAALASARTPDGFSPASDTDLLVEFGAISALNGVDVMKDATQSQPMLATTARLNGTFAIVMVDLDIPTNNPPQTNTLLHWLQTGLTYVNKGTTLNTTNGPQTAYMLNAANMAGVLAPYIGPAPPAKIPLSHRYTQILVDHSNITPDGLSALRSAAQNRTGFNADQVLKRAGLSDKVVAGNWFNVTNPGPASSSGNGSASSTASSSGSTNSITTGSSGSSSGGSSSSSSGTPGNTLGSDAPGAVSLSLLAVMLAVLAGGAFVLL